MPDGATEQLRRRQLEAELAHIGRVHTAGEMAGSLAHEINQPLSAIANYVRGINRRVRNGSIDFDQLSDVMDRVSNEVDRAAEIITAVDPDIIIVGCTSGTLVGGFGYDRQIIEKITRIEPLR